MFKIINVLNISSQTNSLWFACSLPSEHLSNEKELRMRFRALKGDALGG